MWTALTTFLLGITGSLVKKAAVALGFGLVAYVGFDALLGSVIGWIEGSFSSLPSALAHMAGRLGVDQAASIIVSAGVIKMTLRAMSGATSYKPVWRAPE